MSETKKAQSKHTRKFRPVEVSEREAKFAVELRGPAGAEPRRLSVWTGRLGYVWIGPERDGDVYGTLDLSVLRRLLAAVDEWEASR